MRIWDIAPGQLCRKHLTGEHRELHGLWNIVTQGKRGYASHPETRRWMGRLAALYLRHEALATEMERRGYHHQSPLDERLAVGLNTQDRFVNSVDEQRLILAGKPCPCLLDAITAPPAPAREITDPCPPNRIPGRRR